MSQCRRGTSYTDPVGVGVLLLLQNLCMMASVYNFEPGAQSSVDPYRFPHVGWKQHPNVLLQSWPCCLLLLDAWAFKKQLWPISQCDQNLMTKKQNTGTSSHHDIWFASSGPFCVCSPGQDTPDPQQEFHIDTFAPIVKVRGVLGRACAFCLVLFACFVIARFLILFLHLLFWQDYKPSMIIASQVWVFQDPPGVNLSQAELHSLLSLCVLCDVLSTCDNAAKHMTLFLGPCSRNMFVIEECCGFQKWLQLSSTQLCLFCRDPCFSLGGAIGIQRLGMVAGKHPIRFGSTKQTNIAHRPLGLPATHTRRCFWRCFNSEGIQTSRPSSTIFSKLENLTPAVLFLSSKP